MTADDIYDPETDYVSRPLVHLWAPAESPQIAMLLHEYVTGRHPSQVTEEERQRWIRAAEKLRGVPLDVSRQVEEQS
jgi:hypothetical protein